MSRALSSDQVIAAVRYALNPLTVKVFADDGTVTDTRPATQDDIDLMQWQVRFLDGMAATGRNYDDNLARYLARQTEARRQREAQDAQGQSVDADEAMPVTSEQAAIVPDERQRDGNGST